MRKRTTHFIYDKKNSLKKPFLQLKYNEKSVNSENL